MRGLLVVLAAIVVLKLGEQLYRWVAFGEERARIEAMRERVVDAGASLVQARARADTLRRAIEAEDERLAELRRGLDAWGRHAHDGALPGHLYASYRHDLDDFNRRVAARNERAEAWRALAEQSRAAAARYDALADSIRALAREVGDPYYAVPLPAEAATERGLAPPRRAAGPG